MHLRTILITLALLAVVSTATGGLLTYRSLKETQLSEARAQIASYSTMIRNRVEALFEENQRAAHLLAAHHEIKQLLASGNSLYLARTNAILDDARSAMLVDVVYLMDAQGNTLASSNRDSPESFVGHNYAFRPYFSKAMRGEPHLFMALGVTSQKRGFYFSHPVRLEAASDPVGVIVIKARIDAMEEEFRHSFEGKVVLTDAHGTVFLSTEPAWLFTPLWAVPDAAPGRIAHRPELRRTGNQLAEDAQGHSYLLSEGEVEKGMGVQLICLSDLEAISRRLSVPFRRISGYVIIILCWLVAVAVLFLYRRASEELLRRKRAEQALGKSEQQFRMIFENSPLGILHFDHSSAITACNDSILRITGSEREALIGLNLLTSLKSEGMRSAVQACLNGNSGLFEGFYRPTTGARRSTLKATYSPILTPTGEILGGIGIIEDITRKIEMEQRLRASEKELRFLSAKLLTAQEEERKRIAGELHDSIGSSLSAIKFSLEHLVGQLEPGNSSKTSLDALVTMTQQTIDETRRIMTDLRPAMLDDLGIVATVRWFCRRYQEIYGNITVEAEVDVDEEDVPEQLKTVLFRIMQEALHNAAKYSGASRVRLSLTGEDSTLELQISDDGTGFALDQVLRSGAERKGLGLTSMKERAELSGGFFHIDSRPGGGTRIHASWPRREAVSVASGKP